LRSAKQRASPNGPPVRHADDTNLSTLVESNVSDAAVRSSKQPKLSPPSPSRQYCSFARSVISPRASPGI
jgi:hypothetical protein